MNEYVEPPELCKEDMSWIIEEFSCEFNEVMWTVPEAVINWAEIEQQLDAFPAISVPTTTSLRIPPHGFLEKWRFKDSFKAYADQSPIQPKTLRIYKDWETSVESRKLQTTASIKRKRKQKITSIYVYDILSSKKLTQNQENLHETNIHGHLYLLQNELTTMVANLNKIKV